MLSLTSARICITHKIGAHSESCFHINSDTKLGKVHEGDLVTVHSDQGDALSVETAQP